MRDVVVPGALILVVAVLGVLVYFGFKPTVSGPRAAAQQAAAAQAAAEAAQAAEKESARQKASRQRSVSKRAVEAAIESLDELTLDIPASPIPGTDRLTAPFPSERDLLRGMPRNRLRTLFGPPSLRVSATRDGRLVERYVYVKPDRSSATVAYLENGAVVSAETVAQ
jgi:hypothetical protein